MLTLIFLLLMMVFFPGVLLFGFVMVIGLFAVIISSPIFWIMFIGVMVIGLLMQ